MILEIQLNKTSKYIELLSSLGDFIISGNYVYLDTLKDISTVSNSLPITKCQQITVSNYMYVQNDFGRKWCHEMLYKHQLMEFEHSEACQKRLREINELLDRFEKGEVSIAAKEKVVHDSNDP